jgi:hypothetical protein
METSAGDDFGRSVSRSPAAVRNPDITRVTIVPDSSSEFDYLIDTIGITFTSGAAVPEPSSLLLGILALGTLEIVPTVVEMSDDSR